MNASDRKEGTKPRRVLLVDDDKEALQACEDLLSQNGYEVQLCSDPTQAVPLLKAGSYDVALLDIRMPGIEGTDLLPIMKKLCPDLPVIIVSAYCDEKDGNYYRSLGAFEILAKPFSHEALLNGVARAVDREEHIPLTLTSLSLQENRDRLYRKLILSALRKTNWNQVKSAELLGVSRYCLMRWLRKLAISY